MRHLVMLLFCSLYSYMLLCVIAKGKSLCLKITVYTVWLLTTVSNTIAYMKGFLSLPFHVKRVGAGYLWQRAAAKYLILKAIFTDIWKPIISVWIPISMSLQRFAFLFLWMDFYFLVICSHLSLFPSLFSLTQVPNKSPFFKVFVHRSSNTQSAFKWSDPRQAADSVYSHH